MVENIIFEITPQINKLSRICMERDKIEPELYISYDVKRGLRDLNGKGVLAGLTNISEGRRYLVRASCITAATM